MSRQSFALPARVFAGWAAYGAILALGLWLFFLSHDHPAAMPAFGPWDFSPSIYLATALALYWYWCGIALSPPAERPALWRQLAFVSGVVLIYAVLQTRIEYWSQHMFFLNRLQTIAMHDVGPFLIALAWPGQTIKAGMPRSIQRLIESRSVNAIVGALHQPLVAAFLFVGVFYLWLIPIVHFRAMIDHQLYAVMNWTMVLGGLLFWCLTLDPRPSPPAQMSFGVRIALMIGVMLPQMLLGALITFMPRDLYPYYDLCGRLFPGIDPLTDQHIGGIISWVPPGMMSVIGVLISLNFLRLQQDSSKNARDAVAITRAPLASG
jgi:putative membrane protein